MLGIIGGMGPQAGNNLFNCVLKHTKASKDQDHLPIILWSTPDKIADRSEFLLGKTKTNPANVVGNIALQLHQIGVTIIGIPCNTFHAQPIWSKLQQKTSHHPALQIINIVNATATEIANQYLKAKVGILGTMGTYKYNVYGKALNNLKIPYINPNDDEKTQLHQAVYDVDFGIKAIRKISDESLQIVLHNIEQLSNQGATVILLGCTEFSLLPITLLPNNIVFINPVEVLAKAMIMAYKTNLLIN